MPSKAQQRAVTKYDAANYDKILVRLPKGEKEKVIAYATSIEMGLNAFVKYAINKAMISAAKVQASTDSSGTICPNCGNAFESSNSRKKFCSDRCRKHNHKKQKKNRTA